jgi:hypothetical protein
MKPKMRNRREGPLSRRAFVKKAAVVVAAVGATGVIGCAMFRTPKGRSLNNVLRMGHCAPSVMQTLCDLNHVDTPDLVINAGAMAGGIAGSDMECGALTAPLMFMSYQQSQSASVPEKLNLISKAQHYVNGFMQHNHAASCSMISKGGMSSCLKAICTFHQPYQAAMNNPVSLSREAEESYTLLLTTFNDQNFHCAHTVLRQLDGKFSVTPELIRSSWVFAGGLAMMNRTCGALAAGVMALSSISAEMEDSYIRVARMNRLLIQNRMKEAMQENINHFNRAILLSYELGLWFRTEFGATTCQGIWGFNFAKRNEAESFISGGCLVHCRQIARKVAEKVSTLDFS